MSDSPTLCTGYGRVTREILRRLATTDSYDIACLGWHYDGRPYDQDKFPYRIYPSRRAPFGQDALGEVIDDFCPDVLATLGDPYMLAWLPSLRQRRQVTWVGYFPLDGEPIHSSWVPLIEDMDAAVTISDYARKLVARD